MSEIHEIPDVSVFAGDEHGEIEDMMTLIMLIEQIDAARQGGDHVTARRLESDYLGDYSADQINVARQAVHSDHFGPEAIVERPSS